VRQHLVRLGRLVERRLQVVEPPGHRAAEHVTAVAVAHEIALVGQRAHQVVGGGQVEPAPAGDRLHRQRRMARADLLENAQGT
jgi:hypothetical protein